MSLATSPAEEDEEACDQELSAFCLKYPGALSAVLKAVEQLRQQEQQQQQQQPPPTTSELSALDFCTQWELRQKAHAEAVIEFMKNSTDQEFRTVANALLELTLENVGSVVYKADLHIRAFDNIPMSLNSRVGFSRDAAAGVRANKRDRRTFEVE